MSMMDVLCCFVFFKQKTAYEMRSSGWSLDVCSSDPIVAKAAGIGGRRQIDIGGRDQAHVGGQGRAASHPLELAVLADPQDLLLGGQAGLGDFVEKQTGRAWCRERRGQ